MVTIGHDSFQIGESGMNAVEDVLETLPKRFSLKWTCQNNNFVLWSEISSFHFGAASWARPALEPLTTNYAYIIDASSTAAEQTTKSSTSATIAAHHSHTSHLPPAYVVIHG